MKEIYKKHFTPISEPTEDELRKLWKEGQFVFDSSALLNLYARSEHTYKNIATLLTSISDRVWMPHHVGWEFYRGRAKVIKEQAESYEGLKDTLSGVLNTLKDQDSHPHILDTVVEKFERVCIEIDKECKSKKHAIETMRIEGDERLQFLEKLFSDKIGKPYKLGKIRRVEKEGQRRYLRLIPPGYKDIKANDKQAPNRVGDYVIWSQILKYASKKLCDIIFITDDAKEDFWSREHKRDDIPHSELIREFQGTTGKAFWMYNLELFLRRATEYLDARVTEETLKEVKEVKESQEEAREFLLTLPPFFKDVRLSEGAWQLIQNFDQEKDQSSLNQDVLTKGVVEVLRRKRRKTRNRLREEGKNLDEPLPELPPILPPE